MAILRKLKGADATLFKKWLNSNGDTVIDIEGQKYIVKPIVNEVQEEIESDPDLKNTILGSKRDIAMGNVLTTREVLEGIDRGDF